MTGIPEPPPDAPPLAWSCYFADQLRIIREDLAAEGTTLDRVEAEMRRAIREQLHPKRRNTETPKRRRAA
jgi:hypothetical protein